MNDSMQKILTSRLGELHDLCKSLNIKRLYAFGSVMGSNFNDESDIDFLLSFSDDISIEEYTNNYFTLHYKLREMFHREVDIITERTLSNPYLIDSINETKHLIYEA